MVYRVTKTEDTLPLFDGWDETVLWSAHDGTMGEIYTDAAPGEVPASACVWLGEFIFFAGKPSEELVSYRPEKYRSDCSIFVPKTDDNTAGWCETIEKVYGERAKKITRFATSKVPHKFDIELLESTAAALPEGYSFELMNEARYNECKNLEWASDFVAEYPEWELYEENALGVLCIYGGEIVSGMSTFSHFKGGIELELATREDHRRRGLARATAAKMLLECTKRGLYPSWDAANIASITMAKYFGYTVSREYTAYEISDFR